MSSPNGICAVSSISLPASSSNRGQQQTRVSIAALQLTPGWVVPLQVRDTPLVVSRHRQGSIFRAAPSSQQGIFAALLMLCRLLPCA